MTKATLPIAKFGSNFKVVAMKTQEQHHLGSINGGAAMESKSGLTMKKTMSLIFAGAQGGEVKRITNGCQKVAGILTSLHSEERLADPPDRAFKEDRKCARDLAEEERGLLENTGQYNRRIQIELRWRIRRECLRGRIRER